MPRFIHHIDEEILGRHYGSPENIPPTVKAAYFECQRFFHGAYGAEGEFPPGVLMVLTGFQALLGTVAVNTVINAPAMDGTVEPPEPEPPLGDVHSPLLDLAPNTPVRAKGQLGYFVGPWGNEEVRVRIEGDDKPYRRFSINDVEIAV